MIIPELIPEKAMFKTKEVGILFCVHQRKVYNWIQYGKLQAVKVGGVVRVPREAILEFIPTNGKGFLNTSERAVTSRMVSAMRGRINQIIRRGNIKAGTSMKLLGCSREEFQSHIEKQFLPGMTWENYGREGWTIDHIIPCAQFDLSIPDSQKVCFHYTNLQPLWHIDNIKKGKKYTRRNIRKVIRISRALS